MIEAISSQSRTAARVTAEMGRYVHPHDPTVVRETATKFLSDLFFAPLLAEAREFPIGRDLLGDSQTESIFGQQLDQRVADTVAGRSHMLVDLMSKRLVRTPAVAQAASTSPADPSNEECAQ
jgi:hypothetical protein